MSATFTYAAHDASWSVDLGTQAVRLATVDGFTEIAELGATGESTIIIDDPSANVGHSSDAILALQRFYVDEGLASIGRVYAGWTDDRDYARGDTARSSLRTGSARQIVVSLRDGNCLAGRRIIPPVTVDATVSRPSETAAARITWLLGTAYFSGVANNGLVSAASITLDANDYSGQSAADVLNDCCAANGDNWFVYWDRTATAWSLAVFNATTSSLYPGTLRLSNSLSYIDSNLDGLWTAGATDTWAVEPDAVLHRSAATYCNGVLLPYAKGTAYRTTTSASFPNVDHTAPSTSIKTLTKANAQADRFLADNADEADRITCSARIGAANVNDALAGQLIWASFTHLPGYETPHQFRIQRRTVSQVEPTDQFYTCSYELVPASPLAPTYTYAELSHVWGDSVNINEGEKLYRWQYAAAKVGLIDYYTVGHGSPDPAYTGFVVSGSGNLDINVGTGLEGIGFHVLWSGPATLTVEVRRNGSVVASGSGTDSNPDRLHNGNIPTIHFAASIPVIAGDVIQIYASWVVAIVEGGGVMGYNTTGVTVAGYLA